MQASQIFYECNIHFTVASVIGVVHRIVLLIAVVQCLLHSKRKKVEGDIEYIWSSAPHQKDPRQKLLNNNLQVARRWSSHWASQHSVRQVTRMQILLYLLPPGRRFAYHSFVHVSKKLEVFTCLRMSTEPHSVDIDCCVEENFIKKSPFSYHVRLWHVYTPSSVKVIGGQELNAFCKRILKPKYVERMYW